MNYNIEFKKDDEKKEEEEEENMWITLEIWDPRKCQKENILPPQEHSSYLDFTKSIIPPKSPASSFQNSTSSQEKKNSSQKVFLEKGNGMINSIFFNPIECNSREHMILKSEEKEKDGLTKKKYLLNGYVVYLRWLKDKLHAAGLPKVYDDLLHYCFAKYIDSFAFSATNEICKDAMDIYRLPHISLDEMQLYKRLHNLPEKILDKHSSMIWRGTAGMTNNCDFHVSIDYIKRGLPWCPPAGFHLGLKMLEVKGFFSIPEDSREDFTKTKKFTIS